MNEANLTEEVKRKIESEHDTIKKCFRVAYDTLEKMWPPENTEEYWNRVLDRLVEVHLKDEPALLKRLMMALVLYLEDVLKLTDTPNI